MECNSVVPNDINYLLTLPGVGRKTTNVVLANLYNVPSFAVDTHVIRVSKLLGLVNDKDSVIDIERKLNATFEIDTWNRVNDQLILFGRYICKSKKPICVKCQFNGFCIKTKK